jgi:hypothetical protein
VEALGKILLQNIQLMVGKRYAQSAGDRDADEPMLSVILDEFAPFAYPGFTHPIWFAGVTALFVALLGSLAGSGLSRYAAGLAEAAPPVTQPRKRGESPCNAA